MIAASTLAPQVDHIFFLLLAFCSTLTVGVFVAVSYFVIKYAAHRKVDRSDPRKHEHIFEKVWIIGCLVFFIPLFVWGAKTFFALYVPPKDAIEVNVLAKQWMWKFYHPDGIAEINTLHVAVGKPVKLTMLSDDVVHSFFVPAFRIKQDVLPGRYTSLWFTPTRAGAYRLLCTQYCGTSHAAMNGFVIAMNPEDFTQWKGSIKNTINLKDSGSFLFRKYQCNRCHESTGPEAAREAPALNDLMGKTVTLSEGGSLVADDNYIVESILNPSTKVVAGYKDTMPSYQGQISQTDLLALVEYIKSLSPPERQTEAPQP